MTADTPPIEPGHVMPIRDFERIKEQKQTSTERESVSTIESRIKEVIARQLGACIDQIKPESNLIDDLGADSLDEVELVMAIEDEFEFEIPDNDADKIKTVQQAIDYVTAHAGK